MTTVSILPVAAAEGGTIYRALAGAHCGAGMKPGEALDAILAQDESATLAVIHRDRPDRFFSAEQQGRLAELLARRRAAGDAGTELATDEQEELEGLIEAELQGAAQRAASLADELAP